MPAFKDIFEIFKSIFRRIIVKTILFLGSFLILSYFLSGCFFCLGFRFDFRDLSFVFVFLFYFFK
jgi:hypothetical protein